MKESHNSHTEPKKPDGEGCVLCDPSDMKFRNFYDDNVRGWFPWGKVPTGEGLKGTSWVLGNELWLLLGAGHMDVYMYKNSSSCTLGALYCMSVMCKEN